MIRASHIGDEAHPERLRSASRQSVPDSSVFESMKQATSFSLGRHFATGCQSGDVRATCNDIGHEKGSV
jgi:hypothetical protein